VFVRLVASGYIAAILVLASVGGAARIPSDATAVISGSGKRYVLIVTNTGSLPIRCMIFRPNYRVVIVATDGESLVRNEIATAGPRPGETSRTRFRTSRPYPARAGGELKLNNPSFRSTCAFPGRTVRVTGPAKP